MGTSPHDGYVRASGGIGWVRRSEIPARLKNGQVIPLSKQLALQPIGIAFNVWYLRLPEQYTVEDVCQPDLWRAIWLHSEHQRVKPQKGDLIRIVRADDAFDAFFRFDEVSSAGYALSFYFGRLPQPEEAGS